MNFNFDVQNVIEANGVGISITGIVIVFIALTAIAITIALLPKVLSVVAKFVPEPEEGKDQAQAAGDDNQSVIAAIGYALSRLKSGSK